MQKVPWQDDEDKVKPPKAEFRRVEFSKNSLREKQIELDKMIENGIVL